MTGAYSGVRWKTARATALERDNHCCQKCGDEWKIHAHHIIPVREFESEQEAHYPENLVALCQYCHPSEEGKPRWPESGGIETEAGLAHISNLLALRTVSRFTTGEAAPEIFSKRLFTHPDVCACCFRWFTEREPGLRNPFKDYHRSLYRIVVEGKGLDSNTSDPLPNELSFCNDCVGRQRLNRATETERQMVVDHLSTLLRTFGFNSSYTASADFEVLESSFVDNRLNGSIVKKHRHATWIQSAFSLAFGRHSQSVGVGHTVSKAFGHEVSNHLDDISEDDGHVLTEYPDWYCRGFEQA